jgi:hypothetical protein
MISSRRSPPQHLRRDVTDQESSGNRYQRLTHDKLPERASRLGNDIQPVTYVILGVLESFLANAYALAGSFDSLLKRSFALFADSFGVQSAIAKNRTTLRHRSLLQKQIRDS